MKFSATLFSLLALAPALAFADDSNSAPAAAETTSATSAGQASENTEQLWIAVHLPKNTNPGWVGDDLAERFADRIADALRTQGYKGESGTLRPEDPAPGHTAVLIVHLKSWTTRNGDADCTFTASLRTAEGDHDLGLFVGNNLVVTADGQHRFSDDGLVGAALEALDDIYARIRETGLLKAN